MKLSATQPRTRWGSASDRGMVRDENEDFVYADGGLFVVADGVGGHSGGGVASQMATETLVAAAPFSADDLRAAAHHANEVLLRHSRETPGLRGMCTTLCAIAVHGTANSALKGSAVNVGDSRAYRCRRNSNGGELVQLTVDHNVATQRVAEGLLTPSEAKTHYLRHQLTSVVGYEPNTIVDDWDIDLEAGDRLLLCTDGLTEEVGDDEIADILGKNEHPTDIAEALIAAAKANGGSDNITALVVDVLPVRPPPRP